MPASDRTVEPVSERELVFGRVFQAPARLLCQAFSTPDHLTKWFAPPGWTLTRCELDFRTGGNLRLAMTGRDGTEGPAFVGAYIELVPHQRIVYTGAFDTPGAEAMTVTISFDEEGDQTTLTMHTLFASVAMKNEHLGQGYARSWDFIFKQLADHVIELG